jgi:N utilization substance protein B
MGLRRKSREIAVQTLYSLNFVETSDYLGDLELVAKFEDRLIDICEDFDIEKDSKIFQFAGELLKGSLTYISEIDQKIIEFTKNTEFNRLPPIDLSILRIAGYEILYTNTPVPIIINEALEVTRKFSDENTRKFINGVLNSISKDVNRIEENHENNKAKYNDK